MPSHRVAVEPMIGLAVAAGALAAVSGWRHATAATVASRIAWYALCGAGVGYAARYAGEQASGLHGDGTLVFVALISACVAANVLGNFVQTAWLTWLPAVGWAVFVVAWNIQEHQRLSGGEESGVLAYFGWAGLIGVLALGIVGIGNRKAKKRKDAASS